MCQFFTKFWKTLFWVQHGSSCPETPEQDFFSKHLAVPYFLKLDNIPNFMQKNRNKYE